MRFPLLLILFFGMLHTAVAQNDSTISKESQDSAKRSKVRQALVAVSKKQQQEYRDLSTVERQNRLLAALRTTFAQTKGYLRRGINIAPIEEELDTISAQLAKADEGIFVNKGTIQTARNLSTTSILLNALSNRNNARARQIGDYLDELSYYRHTIDSLISDSLMFYVPYDSVHFREFFQKMQLLGKESVTTDSLLSVDLKIIRALDIKCGTLSGSIEAKQSDIESYRKKLSNNQFSREIPDLWGAVGYSRPFGEIVHFSRQKTQMVLAFYIRNHMPNIIILLLVMLGLASYLRTLRRNIKLLMGDEANLVSHLALEHPVHSSIVIVLSIGQFLFPTPPFIFYAIIWTISSIALTIILWNFITSFWRKFWVTIVVLFVMACMINMVLQASRFERYLMLFLSSAGFVVGLYFLLSKHKSELREKRLVIFLWLLVLAEAGAIWANLFGRYNLSKALLTTGFFNLVVGITLLWTVRLLNDIFKFSAEAYRDNEKQRFYIDFNKMGAEAPSYLYFFLGIGWFSLIGRNFYIYNQLTDPIAEFFLMERKIGSQTFSLGSILFFLSIIFIAGLASKIVSFFVGGSSYSADNTKKGGIGSWLLLIRIAIICTGVFLAFAATGIPIDKITIVLGALSVGIGFGLQSLVTNLVSGLIIAFEKPINVGDIVEVGGRSGTMKSIGFRSSVVTTADGSNVVIPNGNLLEHQLINFANTNPLRKVEIMIGVGYETDLDDAIKKVLDIIANDNRILKMPPPQVLVHEFESSTIQLRIIFHAESVSTRMAVRSDIMLAVRREFAANNILIPYPQVVVHKANDEEVDPLKK